MVEGHGSARAPNAAAAFIREGLAARRAGPRLGGFLQERIANPNKPGRSGLKKGSTPDAKQMPMDVHGTPWAPDSPVLADSASKLFSWHLPTPLRVGRP
jgi:hypothetical protein